MQSVSIGLFKLPGIKLDNPIQDETAQTEIINWLDDHKGRLATDTIIVFKKEAERDLFLLTWSEAIAKLEKSEKLI